MPPGEATIRFEFDYDGGGPGRGGTGRIYVDDVLAGEGRIESTQPLLFSADETADVGIDLQTPVVESLGAGEDTRFTGQIPQRDDRADLDPLKLPRHRRPNSPMPRNIMDEGRLHRLEPASVGPSRHGLRRRIFRDEACSDPLRQPLSLNIQSSNRRVRLP